jgi:hypothetical protein
MGKFNLTEAAKDILAGSIASAGGEKQPQKLSGSVAYDTKEVGDIGSSPEKMDDHNPDYTKGTPSATPPGATPPVGSEPAKKLTGQPQETQGRADLATPVQAEPQDINSLVNRVKAKLAAQTMQSNPGATFQSYGEEAEVSDEEMVAEEKDEDEKEDEKEEMKKKVSKEKMKEDIDALFTGESLSEEFKQKVETIFEAAVIARAEEVIAESEAELMEQFQVAVQEIKEEMASKIDDYLNYMVEEWMTENELAIESGLRSEIAEEFMEGLRNLFVEHYIEIPQEKVDVVEELTSKVEELEQTVNEQINKNIELNKELNEQKKIEAIYTACEGLTQTQVEKLKSLAEGVEYTTEEEFGAKLSTLKESYFKTEVKVANSSALNEEIEIEEEKKTTFADPSMEIYAKTISQTVVK